MPRKLTLAAIFACLSLSALAAEHRQSSDGQVAQTVYQVNVNTATAEELQRLYRTGPAIAEKIIAGRPYQTLVELVDRVPGIGARWAACNGDFVSFDGPSDLQTKVACPGPAAQPQR